MKKWVALTSLMLAVSACSGESAATTVNVGVDTTVGTSESTTTLTAPDTTTSEDETTTTSDRELAPDFTLELGEGGEYTLSDGARPVYLVFWAEW